MPNSVLQERCSEKAVHSEENTCAGVSFLMKFQVLGLQFRYRCFAVNFGNFFGIAFYREIVNGC